MRGIRKARESGKERGEGKRRKGRQGKAIGELCIYSVILCICILLMFLLWNHFYSNPRLRRPSHGRVAGRDGWVNVRGWRVAREKKREEILSFKLYYSLKMMI